MPTSCALSVNGHSWNGTHVIDSFTVACQAHHWWTVTLANSDMNTYPIYVRHHPEIMRKVCDNIQGRLDTFTLSPENVSMEGLISEYSTLEGWTMDDLAPDVGRADPPWADSLIMYTTATKTTFGKNQALRSNTSALAVLAAPASEVSKNPDTSNSNDAEPADEPGSRDMVVWVDEENDTTPETD